MAEHEKVGADSPGPSDPSLVDIDVDDLSSEALRRLVEEARNEEPSKVSGYNRSYHRHNR